MCRLHTIVKAAIDPDGLMNPGKFVKFTRARQAHAQGAAPVPRHQLFDRRGGKMVPTILTNRNRPTYVVPLPHVSRMPPHRLAKCAARSSSEMRKGRLPTYKVAMAGGKHACGNAASLSAIYEYDVFALRLAFVVMGGQLGGGATEVFLEFFAQFPC